MFLKKNVMLIKMDDPERPTYDPVFLEATLLIVNSMAFVAFFVSALLLLRRVRRRIRKKSVKARQGERNGTVAKKKKIAASKVVPAQPLEAQGEDIKNWS